MVDLAPPASAVSKGDAHGSGRFFGRYAYRDAEDITAGVVWCDSSSSVTGPDYVPAVVRSKMRVAVRARLAELRRGPLGLLVDVLHGDGRVNLAGAKVANLPLRGSSRGPNRPVLKLRTFNVSATRRRRGSSRWGLLRERMCGVAKVAQRVGYGSASAFSVAFHRYVGMPPTQYAREAPSAP